MKFERRTQEEFEIDPNSAFNKLKKLQRTLKEEIALKDIFNKNKDEMLSEMDFLVHKYFKCQVKAKELFDFNNQFLQDKTSLPISIKCDLVENSASVIPQFFDPLSKLLFTLQGDYSKMFDFIECCEKRDYDEIAFFVGHLFYQNIYSSKSVSDRLMVLIYLLLEKEVDKMTIQNSALSFLDESFLTKLLKNLARKEDIKTYLGKILSLLLLKMENDKNKYICLDYKRIKEDLMEYNAYKEKKKTSDTVINKEKEKNVFSNFDMLFANNTTVSKSKIEEDVEMYITNEITISKCLRHFNDNGIQYKSFNFLDDDLKNNPILYIDDEEDEDDLEKDILKGGGSIAFNNSYKIPLTISELNNLADKETNKDMRLFYQRQRNQYTKDGNLFTNTELIKKLKDLSGQMDKIPIVFKDSFIKIREFIDELIHNLIKNITLLPESIKCIALIISKLIKQKQPNLNTIELNSYLGKFFFEQLIFPILFNPIYNGILTSTVISSQTMTNMIIISKILKRLLHANLFTELSMTIFNRFFIEIMPSLLKFFNALTQTSLPDCIEKLLNDKQKQDISNRAFEYDYFKENPNEKMEHQSICFSWSNFITFYNVIEKNKTIFLKEANSSFSRTFKKLGFHETSIRNKYQQNENDHLRTYLLITKINYSKEFSKKLEVLSKQQQFSFEAYDVNDKNDNEKFILARVKYCISTIIRHLNILTRANFFIDASESTENFVLGLNKMIELEGFSDMLKEKTIPLSWYGLYLQANIESIPVPQKRANYFQLYEELLNDSYKSLQTIIKDDSLNYIFAYKKMCQKAIEIIDQSLTHLTCIEKNIEIYRIASGMKLPVIIKKIMKKKDFVRLEIDEKANFKGFSFWDKKKCIELPCNELLEFICNFPIMNEFNQKNIFIHQELLGIPEAIESYCDYVKNYIDKDSLFSASTWNDKFELAKDITAYIQKRLYIKIYPKRPDLKDNQLYDQCLKLKTIKQEDIIKKEYHHYINEQMIAVTTKYLNYMKYLKTPHDKMKALSNVYLIVKNNCAFFSIENEPKEQDLINLLAYIIIKAQPSYFCSEIKYIELYTIKANKNHKLTMLFNRVIQRIQEYNCNNIQSNNGEHSIIYSQSVYVNQTYFSDKMNENK